jgi:ribonuclease HII
LSTIYAIVELQQEKKTLFKRLRDDKTLTDKQRQKIMERIAEIDREIRRLCL